MPDEIAEIPRNEFLIPVHGFPLVTIRSDIALIVQRTMIREIPFSGWEHQMGLQENVRVSEMFFSRYGAFGFVEIVGSRWVREEEKGKILLMVNIPVRIIRFAETVLEESGGRKKVEAFRKKFFGEDWNIIERFGVTLDKSNFGNAARLFVPKYYWALIKGESKNIFSFNEKYLPEIIKPFEDEIKEYLKEFDAFVDSLRS